MTVRRWRGRWVVDFTTREGNRVRRVAPVQTRRGAEEYEAEIRAGFWTSKESSEPKRVGFREFAVEWLKTYAAVNNKPSEVVTKEWMLRVHLSRPA